MHSFSHPPIIPTIKRFAAASIKIYADDHHPPHFHIVGATFQVIVRLDDLAILAGSARARDIAEAMAWAADNRTLLVEQWQLLNERA